MYITLYATTTAATTQLSRFYGGDGSGEFVCVCFVFSFRTSRLARCFAIDVNLIEHNNNNGLTLIRKWKEAVSLDRIEQFDDNGRAAIATV